VKDMIETVQQPGTELLKEDLKKLYSEQSHLKIKKVEFERIIDTIVNEFDTREAIRWEKAKKIAKIELLNQYILMYNQVRKHLIEVNKKIKRLEEEELTILS
jgi:hypothetical protein